MVSRTTEQRRAILEALRGSDRAVTAQELHARLEGVGLATVYRNLQRLADEGEADTLRRDSGEVAFLVCGGGHHHHLTCRSCGRVEEVRDCRLGDWARAVADDHGFSEVEHRAELVGTCATCADRA
jgi:Fur family transcriptional regulator, ferric uptake regulator